jgi:hypothetical protein
VTYGISELEVVGDAASWAQPVRILGVGTGMARRLALSALTALVLALPSAAVAAPWSAPAAIRGSHDDFAQVVAGPLVAWSEGGALGTGTPRLLGASGLPLGATRKLGRLRLTALGAYRGHNVFALGATGNQHSHTAVAHATTGSRFSTPRALGPDADSFPIALAVADAGDAAVLLRSCGDTSPCRRFIPYLVVRHHGTWGAPIRLDSHAHTLEGAVAIDPRGDVLAVWERPLRGTTGVRGVYARLRTAGGRLGATQQLGTSVPIPAISAALGPGRRAVVAWKGQSVSEGDATTPATVQAAVAAPDRRFGAAQRLEVVNVTGTGRYVGQAGVDTAFAADGRALVAWTGYARGHFVVRAARVSGTRVGTGQVVSDPAHETVLSDLATGTKGQALVLGLQGLRGNDPTGPVSVVAAARPAGAATFGAPEAITAPGQFFEAAQAAFQPDGRAVAVWRSLAPGAVMWAVRDAF